MNQLRQMDQGRSANPGWEVARTVERLASERIAVLEAENAEMRKRIDRLEVALDAAGVGTWVWELGSKIPEWDFRMRMLYGLKEDEPPSIDAFLKRVHPLERKVAAHELEALAAGQADGEAGDVFQRDIRIMHPVLGERWISSIGKTERDDDGEICRLSGVNFDITDRKLAEEALHKSEEKYRRLQLLQSESRFLQLVEVAFEGIIVIDDGIILDANTRFAKMVGYDLSEILGSDAIHFVAPESRKLVGERIRNHDDRPCEFMALRKDGSVFPVLFNAKMREWDGHANWVIVLLDLSEIKRAKAKIAIQNEQLSQAMRLALASEISTGIVHQIGQPLTAMGVNLAVASGRFKACDMGSCNLKGALSRVEADIARMREVIRHLRVLATPMQREARLVAIGDVISDAIKQMRDEALAHGVSLVVDLKESLPVVWVDAVQMVQVFVNLIRNAIEVNVAGQQGNPSIRVRARELDGKMLEVSVRDRGTGLTPEVLNRLFSPYFSTKPGGMGIGLRLSQTIVHAHNGTLEGLNNTDGPGATFRVLLPIQSLEPDKN